MATLTGTSGADALSGDAADDVIIGLDGADTLYGGDGNDTLIITPSGTTGAGVIDGGPGVHDALDLTGVTLPITLTSGQTSGDPATLQVGAATFTVAGIETFYLGDGGSNVSLTNYVSQSGSTPAGLTIFGGAGRDIIVGSGVGDVIYGGAGDDFINPGSGTDQVFGGDGNDRLFGSVAETLYGGAGADAEQLVRHRAEHGVEGRRRGHAGDRGRVQRRPHAGLGNLWLQPVQHRERRERFRHDDRGGERRGRRDGGGPRHSRCEHPARVHGRRQRRLRLAGRPGRRRHPDWRLGRG